jgi:predicted nucleotidyltransferase
MNDLTPYADINTLLQTLLTRIQPILGAQFVGMYVHGSLAAGDFDPTRSDVDWLVVTADKLADDTLVALEAMHAAITRNKQPWTLNHEGSYIPQKALRRYDPMADSHPALGTGGHFQMMQHGSGWILQRYVAREYGITLAGEPIKALIDPLTATELRAAARDILLEWWLPLLNDMSRLMDAEYQAYAVLTMCRILYTGATGAVTSKPQAAQWAQRNVPAHWQPLIQHAAAWRHGSPMDVLADVVAFIRYTVEQSH